MVSTPEAPDPYETAAAQGAANAGAAVAGSVVNNMNQVGPNGRVTYQQSGTQKVEIAPGEFIDVPRYTQTTTLSPAQQNLLHLQNRTMQNLGATAVQQSAKLQDHLRGGINVDKLERTGDLQEWADIPKTPKLITNINLKGVDQSPAMVRDYVDKINSFQNDYVGGVKNTYGPDDYEAARKSVEDATFSRYASDYDDKRKALQSELAGRGLMEGSAAWNKAMDELNRERTDAKYQAVLAGGQEQSRLSDLTRSRAEFENAATAQKFGQSLGANEFENQAAAQMQQQTIASAMYKLQRGESLNSQELAQMEAINNSRQMEFGNNMSVYDAQNAQRQAQLQEQFSLRNQPINEITALLGGTQVSMPQAAPIYRQGVEPAPVADSVYRSYAANAANAQAGMSGLFGLGSSALGAIPGLLSLSDRREKKDVEKIGKTPGGYEVYSYRYKDGKPRGPSLFEMDDDEIGPSLFTMDMEMGPDGAYAVGEKSVGVMAQEVEKKDPKAVKTVRGRKMVDYARVY